MKKIIMVFLFLFGIITTSFAEPVGVHVVNNQDGYLYVYEAFKNSSVQLPPAEKYVIIGYPTITKIDNIYFKHYNYQLTFYRNKVDCQIINLDNDQKKAIITSFDKHQADSYDMYYDPIEKKYTVRYNEVWSSAFSEGVFPELITYEFDGQVVVGNNFIKFLPKGFWQDIKDIHNSDGSGTDFPQLPLPEEGLTMWVPLILEFLAFFLGSLLGLVVLVKLLKKFIYF